MPTISVLISYYNDEKFLKDAIHSVLNQTLADWELVLLNHASTDSSRQIAHSFKDRRIKHIDLPKNFGATGNVLLKTALDAANGEFIKALSADDILVPDALETLLHSIQLNQADVVFGDLEFVNVNKKPLNYTWFKNRLETDENPLEYLRLLLNGVNPFPYAGHLIRKQALQAIPLDYISISVADMGIWTEFLLKGYRLAFIDKIVALYRIHPEQMCHHSKKEITYRRNNFELLRYIRHFLEADLSVPFLKAFLPDSIWAQQLAETEKEFVPFVLAQYITEHSKNPTFILMARLKIADILDDYLMQQKLEKRFAWGIKELREQITNSPLYISKNIFQQAKDLPLSTLAYCFFRKIAHILLLRNWRHNRRTKKEHTI